MRMIVIAPSRLVRVIHDVRFQECDVEIFPALSGEDTGGLNIGAVNFERILGTARESQLGFDGTATADRP